MVDFMELKNKWKQDEDIELIGWDFSHINNRYEEGSLSWDYRTIVKEYLKHEHKLLDMGTGGGEFLLELGHTNSNTSVTESYPPNVSLCLERLQPLGITVKQVYSDNLIPFDDETFDIVINRHDDYTISEVKRILKHNGIFITQQVGDRNSRNLARVVLPDYIPEPFCNNLEHAKIVAEALGFDIIFGKEEFPKTRFFDIGAFVYFAKIIEWEFPDFSVDKCFKQLCSLQDELEEKGYIENHEHRFIIVLKKLPFSNFSFNYFKQSRGRGGFATHPI